MILRPRNHMNVWVAGNHVVDKLHFYTKDKGVVATSDLGYLPEGNGAYSYTAPDCVKEISDVLVRRSVEVGMRHGGHFCVKRSLYLDLNCFSYWQLDERVVQKCPGFDVLAKGIVLQYSTMRVGTSTEWLAVERFVWDRSTTTEQKTPMAPKIAKLQEWFNKHVADHPNRYLGDGSAERMILRAGELIELLKGMEE